MISFGFVRPFPIVHSLLSISQGRHLLAQLGLLQQLTAIFLQQMFSSAIRAKMATSFAARRGFPPLAPSSVAPYHYAEGPRTNIPFNPMTKHFFWRYWAFMSLFTPDLCAEA